MTAIIKPPPPPTITGSAATTSARSYVTRQAIERLRQQEQEQETALERTRDQIRRHEALLASMTTEADRESLWRRAIRELGTFTVSELAAEMECTPQTAKKHIESQLLSGALRAAGRIGGGKKIYEWVRPEDAGEAFRNQQRLRVADEPAVRLVRDNTSHRTDASLVGQVSNKDVRQAVKEAVQDGWRLTRRGDDHFRLEKDGVRVGVPGTPKSGGTSAMRIRAATQRGAA